MKRNLFLALILLTLPLTAESTGGSFSSGNGGVAALPSEDTATLTVSGNQRFSDCVANGQGGVFAVLAEGSLTLHTDGGEVMEFADNRDCAVPAPSGVGFRGIPNDVYLGAGAALIVDTAAGSEVIMRSGITADDGAGVVKNGAGTWILADTADASRFRGSLHLAEGTLVLGEGVVFGAPSATSSISVCSDLQLQEGAALGTGMIVLGEGGSITGTVHTFGESGLMVNGEGFTINGDMELAGGTIQFMGGSLTVNGDIRTYADTAWEIVPDYYQIGRSYEILTCTGGTEPGGISFGLPTDSRTVYETETVGNTIVLHVSGSAAKHLTWQGGKGKLWTADPTMEAWLDETEETAEAFYSYDVVNFTNGGSVTIAGQVMPGNVHVDIDKTLTFTVDKKLGGGICGGNTSVGKTGVGTLILNNGNSYGGGTILDGGTIKAAGNTSFGTGEIRVFSGTLDLAGKAVANDLLIEDAALVKNGSKFTGTLILDGNLLKGSSVNLARTAELDGGTVDGVLSGTAGALVSGDVTFNTTNTYKGTTTIQAGGHLTLGAKGGVSGDISVLGGELSVTALKGLTLAKNRTLVLYGGSISGLVTIGTGSTLVLNGGSMEEAPVLKGGTLDLCGTGILTLTGSKASVLFGDTAVALPGKGTVKTNDALIVTGGTVTVSALSGYDNGIGLTGGTLKLATGKAFTDNKIVVSGDAAVVNGKTHSGDIIVSGTLTKGTAITLLNAAQRVELNGDGIMYGSISGAGRVVVNGDVDVTAAKFTNAAIELNGTLRHLKGLTLAKGQTMSLGGGFVDGALTVGTGSTLAMNGHTLDAAPVLKGGTADMGGTHTLALTGSKSTISIQDQEFTLMSKSYVKSDAELTVAGGTVTINDFGDSARDVHVTGGTLKLATGKVPSANTIKVNGTAAVVNGALHSGDISIDDGTFAKGTSIKLTQATQCVSLNGDGSMLGTITGTGIVDVNASINATAAKISVSRLNLNKGTYINTKGITVAKGQTLALAGAALELGPKGTLSTAVGSTLVVSRATTLSGNLTFGGGTLVFAGGTLDVSGSLTLSKPVSVTGSGVITYGTLKPFKGDIAVLFGGAEVELDAENSTLTVTGGVAPSSRAALAPAVEGKLAPTQPDGADAVMPVPAANPLADAMVQADWGIIDANRAFMGAVDVRYQHAALLDKGQGAVWMSAFGSFVRHGNKGVHNGADGNIEGAAFGLEHAVTETGSIGLAIGRSKNRLAATGVTHLRQETAHVALYGQKQFSHGFTADAAAAWGDTETKLGGASWSQKSAALSARLTHALMLTDATAFRTFGGLSYEATDSAHILGAAHSGSAQNLRAELGAGMTHAAGKAHLYAEAALTGDIVRHNPTADLGGIRSHGANPGRIGVRATLGGIYEFTNTWSGTASYGIEAESRSTAHTLNVGVSKAF